MDRLPDLASELIRLKANIIITASLSGIEAAKQARTTGRVGFTIKVNTHREGLPFRSLRHGVLLGVGLNVVRITADGEIKAPPSTAGLSDRANLGERRARFY